MDKVTRVTTKSRLARDENMANKLRQQGMLRFEYMKAREMRAANELTGTTIVTPTIARLQVFNTLLTYLLAYLL